MSAIDSRSSMAAVFTVPAVPMTQNGSSPALRSSAIAARSASSRSESRDHRRCRKRLASESQEVRRPRDRVVGLRRRVGHERLPRRPWNPWTRMFFGARALRATASPVALAIDVPVRRTPVVPFGKTEDRAAPRDDGALDVEADVVRPPQLESIAAATSSATMPDGKPTPWTQPKNRGCRFPAGYGKNQLHQIAVSRRKPLRCDRQRLRELPLHDLRNRLPDRPLAHVRT